MTILELRDVTVRSRENGDLILDGVSCKVEEEDRVLIRGPSGSGKTTLFHAILGGIPIDSGEILFKNELITEDNIREIRTRISAVSQEPVLGGGTVQEGLLLPFSFRQHEEKYPSREQISKALNDLGLNFNVLDQSVSDLSGGEKQRIAIARALLLGSTIFLLDEVTSALDPENRDRVINALSLPGHTVLSISHDRTWESRFNEIWKLEKGRLTRESESSQ